MALAVGLRPWDHGGANHSAAAWGITYLAVSSWSCGSQLGKRQRIKLSFVCVPCRCLLCAAGTAAPTGGSQACTPCAPGTFAASPGMAACNPCSQGKLHCSCL